jgi:alkyl hydroperoxide reductase subunit AhpC
VLSLNAPAPPFALRGVQAGAERTVTLAELRGRWVVLVFYPADFTFVCPTEIRGFQQRLSELRAKQAEVVAIGVDDLASHRAWAEELGGVSFPLLSDPGGQVCRAYGVLDAAEGRPFRATVIVSPEGRIAHLLVSPMNVGRSVEETVRVLDALQTGRLCPADWRSGEPTIAVDATHRF